MKSNKRLAHDFLENKLTIEDRDKFFSSLKEKGMLTELSNAFDEDIENKTSFRDDRANEIDSESVFHRIKDDINRAERHQIRYIFKIVASILLPLLIVNISLWYYFTSSNEKVIWNEIHVPKGETSQFIFQDGTKVFLNADSKLSYPTNFKGDIREVKLDGEAYFEVSKNPDKLFLVATGKLMIKVYGTSFKVNGYSSSNKVTARLDEGSISLLLPNQQEQKLEPGYEASFNTTTGSLTMEKSSMSGKPSWQTNQLEFNNITLEEVVEIMERTYNVNITIGDNTIKHYNYHLKFNKATIDEVFDALQLITPIRVKKEGDKYLIHKS